MPDDVEGAGGVSLETVTYYDYKGRVIQTVERNHLGGISRYSTEYDFVGNVLASRESHQKSSGAVADVVESRFTYDHRSRLLSDTTILNNGTPAVVKYAYDGLGKLASKTYGSGTNAVTENYTYNIQGWLTGQSNSLFEMNLRYFDPQFASTAKSYTGNISEWEWQHKNMPSNMPQNTYAFGYDALGRLKTADHYEGTSLINKYQEQITGYTANGNITGLTRKSNGTATTYTNTYLGNRLLTSNSRSYVYDANGNMTTDGLNALNLEYNFLNLVGKIKSGSTVKASYSWLTDGMKLGVVGENSRGGFEYLGSLIYTRSNGTTLSLESAGFSVGRIYTTTGGTEAQYFLTDHLGSVREVFTVNGTTVGRKHTSDYYPFGLRWEDSRSMASDNRWLFNGKEKQTTGELDYLDYGARMYDPTIGRWFNVDPMAEKYYSLTPYDFVGGNPILRVDPNRMDWWEGIKTMLSSLSGNVSVGLQVGAEMDIAGAKVGLHVNAGRRDAIRFDISQEEIFTFFPDETIEGSGISVGLASFDVEKNYHHNGDGTATITSTGELEILGVDFVGKNVEYGTKNIKTGNYNIHSRERSELEVKPGSFNFKFHAIIGIELKADIGLLLYGLNQIFNE